MPPALLHRAALLLTLIALLGACGGGTGTDGKDKTTPPPPPKERLTIVCTTPIVREMIVKLAGDKHDVHCLMKPGDSIDPFDLHPGDVQLLQSADLVFTHGLKLEGAALETIAAHVDASKLIALAEGSHIRNRPKRETTTLTPYCWANPWLHGMLVTEARDALSKTDPKNKAFFATQAEAYDAELRALSEWIAAQRREQNTTGGVITNLATVVELAGVIQQRAHLHPIDAARQPTVADRDRLLAAMKESGARVIAIDPGSNQAMVEMLLDVAKATGGRVVSPPMTDWPRGENETYVAWTKANVETLVKAIK